MLKKTYRIPDMQCPNCAMILESIEDKLPGIQEINASYKRAEMVVEFDETKVTEAQIIAAVEKKGYQVILA
jgi:copper chaperone CopZ